MPKVDDRGALSVSRKPEGRGGRCLSRSAHREQSEENLLQRGPRLGCSVVDQDLQPWKPAKQLVAGFLSGRFAIVMSLEVTIDNKREAVRRRCVRSLNVSRLNLVGQCSGLFHWVPSSRYRIDGPVSEAIIPTSRRDDDNDDVSERLRLVQRGRDASGARLARLYLRADSVAAAADLRTRLATRRIALDLATRSQGLFRLRLWSGLRDILGK
jgi:hypothetical protein